MAITLISTPQILETPISGPGNANRLFILSGSVDFELKGTGGEWKRDTLTIHLNKTFLSGKYINGIGTASLSTVYNQQEATNAGWAVEKVSVNYSKQIKKPILTAQVAVRDSDGYLSGIAYEVFILATA